MKTILVPIYHGGKAKSFFHTDMYPELLAGGDIRMVIAIPPAKIDFYRKQYPEKNVIFEPIELKPEPRYARVLARVSFNLLPTSTVRGKQKLYYYRYGNYFKFFILRFLNYVLGPLPVTRDVVRLLDRLVPTDKAVDALFEKYKPDLLIAPDIVFGSDRLFTRAARRRGIFVVGMARSWDNLTSKGFIQVLPDKLIVYTPQMVREAGKIVGMKSKDIFMGGPPQFDVYYKKGKKTREEFLSGLGIGQDKKIILAAPFFDRYTGSAVKLINELADAIGDGRLPKNAHVLVRYRPGTPPIKEGLLKKSPHITVADSRLMTFEKDNAYVPLDDFEWTMESVDFLADSLRFSDVVINTVSTLSVDAAAFDKPVINLRFDGDPTCPPEHSVTVMLPDHDHYKAIEASGGVKLVWNMDEFIKAVDDYLKNPKLDAEGRERLRREQIVYTDGLAGHRIADFIKGELAKI